MRHALPRIAILGTLWLLASHGICAQQSEREAKSDSSCASQLEDDQRAAGPKISIVQVTFSGTMQLPIPDQEQIAGSIKQKVIGLPFEDAVDQALERVRAGWQDRGYFKVIVSGHTKTLTSNAAIERIALDVQVEEGSQYRLGSIAFKNNRAVSNPSALRSLFPIEDGEIFSREKVATGLDNLRKAYTELGYLNFTSIPKTAFDEENNRISLQIEVDEGMQFFVSSVDVLGVDDVSGKQISKDLLTRPGQVYNSRLWELDLVKYGSKLPDCECRTVQFLNEKQGTISLTLDFRPCSVQ